MLVGIGLLRSALAIAAMVAIFAVAVDLAMEAGLADIDGLAREWRNGDGCRCDRKSKRFMLVFLL